MPAGTIAIWCLATGVVLLALSPRTGHRLRWPLAAIALALVTRYLAWRGLFTLNLAPPHIFISLPLFIAEVYFGIQFVLFCLQVVPAAKSQPKPSQLATSPWVDVFILTYNEPLDILRNTAMACLSLEYPKKRVYLLDDGNRQEVRALAEHIGTWYLSRKTNVNAKAGNINAALERTDGEFVAFFDCDHVPVRTFLTETLGYFGDPRVAFVQTVQRFYNPDPFQRNLRLGDRLPHEQELFFEVIMPGRNAYNAAFWTGTAAVFRRQALLELGGVLTSTLTEDFHTSLELNRRGWRSVHLDRALSAGLAPESFAGYLSQRLRWTHGMFRVWWKSNPLVKSGLSPGQRLCHAAAVYYFLYGLARLPFLAAPLTFLFLGLTPLSATPQQFMAYYVPAYISLFVVLPLVSNGKRLTLASEIYETATCLFQAPVALASLILPRRWSFKVTPKGLEHSRPRFSLLLAGPQAVVLALCVAGLVLGATRLISGLPQDEQDATIINMVWALYNAFLLLAAVAVAREQPQARGVFPRKLRLSCHLQLDTAVVSGEILSMSAIGVTIMTTWRGPVPELFSLKIFGKEGETLEVTGHRIAVRANAGAGKAEQHIDVRFILGSDSRLAAVNKFLITSPWVWERRYEPKRQVWRGLLALVVAPFVVWTPQIRRPASVTAFRPRFSRRPVAVER